ncbi:hypothetical protein [Sorangium sp. So ce363]|uniref:hypothetical protein n=1 Tax=unclassified Sorangium TaxID=2621164 RepID=UPI003F5F6ABB
MQEIKQDDKVTEQGASEMDLFGCDITPEALERYVLANYTTAAQSSLLSALALAQVLK